MNRYRARITVVLPFLQFAFITTRTLFAQAANLTGTSWQLVHFQGGDGSVLTPDSRAKYTIAFANNGRVSARIDCNRGNGTWRSAGPNHLEFGPLTLTRMLCPPGSLHNQIVRQWPYVRSYMIRNGNLFLSLMADGGIYEFEPLGNDEIPTSSVRGTATYRERIVLPANAVFEVSLEDLSRAGAPSALIARVRNEQPGNSPIPFVISYDAGRINQRRSYAVRARILVDDRLWFTTDQNYPVLTAGYGSDVQLVLRRVSGAARPLPGNPSAASLENTYWRLASVGTVPVMVRSQQREPHFILHPANRSVTGSGGCNRLTGSYELNADRLSFRGVASTKMACVDGMETEQAYLNALGRVYRWRISGQSLELFDFRGNGLARFEAVYTR